MSGNQVIELSRALYKRLLSNWSDQIHIQVIPSIMGDVFEVKTDSLNRLVIGGNNVVSIASGLRFYLTKYCKCHISWCGNQLNLPETLPLPEETVRQEATVDHRYYLNFCTYSYSMAWWDWQRWEKEIDWMAFHGINMPLNILGHEFIWLEVGKKLGLSSADIKDFVAGPAFLAWQHMGNVDGIGGPIPDNFIEFQRDLQLKLLERQRAYGMTPVLHGFFGHIPKKLKELHPESTITQLESWYGVEGVYFLDPKDTLFEKVASIYYATQTQYYGTDHFYAMDLFHEGSSPQDDDAYKSSRAKAVMDAMLAADSKGVWVMQSWSMQDCLVKDLPKKHLMLLDLHGEKAPKWEEESSFQETSWIWCLLHNFGGRHGLSGNLFGVHEKCVKAFDGIAKNTLTGLGFAPEAIEECPVFYELVADFIWEHPKNIDMHKWMDDYLHCRYGVDDMGIKKSWDVLLNSVYAGVNTFGPTDSIICARPAPVLKKVVNSLVEPYFDIHDLLDAWHYMLEADPHIRNTETYNYDLTDVARETLAMYARPVYLAFMKAFQSGDLASFQKHYKVLHKIMMDLDELLAHDRHFLLGKWIASALACAKTPEEETLYNFNARMQVTRWWPDVSFPDYAHKHWSGLIRDYYVPRWEYYYNALNTCLMEDKEPDYDFIINSIIDLEDKWIHEAGNKYTTLGKSPDYNYVKELYNTYKVILEDY